MARYTGPKHRLARKAGINLLDKASNSLKRRLMVPPGVHGKKRKRRLSEFGTQMQEKQKAKVTYGLLEKQFKNLVKTIKARKGDTGEIVIATLERRLDSVVYRLGFAKTRFMARQIVSHGHIFVNGKKVNIPSFQVNVEDVVSVAPKIQKNVQILDALKAKEEETILPFLKRAGLSGKLVRLPKKDDVEIPFNMQLIIEYYSR